jgi:5-methylcytosine-specific restriction protein A
MPSRVSTHKPSVPAGPTRHQVYAQYRRDRESNRFYSSAVWRKLRSMQLRKEPLCEECRRQGRLTLAEIVHHRTELRADPTLALAEENLESLCSPCHTRLHKAESPGMQTD